MYSKIYSFYKIKGKLIDSFYKMKGKLLVYGAKNIEFFGFGGCLKYFMHVINIKKGSIRPLPLINDEHDEKDTCGGGNDDKIWN